MQADEIKELLFKTGHFNNPSNPTGVLEEELPLLQLSDDPVRIALQSYQEFHADQYNLLNLELGNGSNVSANGLLSTATKQLLAMPRCSVPDFAPTGTGSWPKNCSPLYPNQHASTFNVVKSGIPTFLAPHFEAAWELCAAAYADMGYALVREDGNSAANSKVTFERLGGSTIGLAIVGRNQTCRTKMWAKFSPTYRPQNLITGWARLLAHEIGHNCGMGHFRGGIMNAIMNSTTFTPTQWRGDPAESTVKRYYGGIPIGPIDPPPGKDPDTYWFKGHFTLMHGETPIEDYILRPKPKV